ncbi:hypothetical protein KIN20_019774, partial [Parelaphostrongylus tenuis]
QSASSTTVVYTRVSASEILHSSDITPKQFRLERQRWRKRRRRRATMENGLELSALK